MGNKWQARARVKLTLMIDSQSVWGADCTAGQVVGQAEREVLEQFESHMAPTRPMRPLHFSLVKRPEVEMVLVQQNMPTLENVVTIATEPPLPSTDESRERAVMAATRARAVMEAMRAEIAVLKEERTTARVQAEQSDALFASIRQIVGHRDQGIEVATRMAIQARDVTIRNQQEEIERLKKCAEQRDAEFSKEVERLTALLEKSR